MAVVVDLVRGIDAAQEGDVFVGPIGEADPAGDVHARRDAPGDPRNVKNLSAFQAKRLTIFSILEL